jgi:di/tricarboxylate transporter
MSDSTTILLIIVAAIVLFIMGRIPVMLVALGVSVALYFTGLVTEAQAFAGFGDPVIIFIAGLFIVAVGLETTGVTAWVGKWLAGVVKGSRLRLAILTVISVALLSPLISMSGAVAAFVPVVTLLALKMNDAPSKYLIPLAFASGAGSKLALTGTPKNVLVSDAAFDAGYGHFGFFEFAWVGVPLLLGTILIVGLFGRRLLPERTPANLPADFGAHAQTLVEQYRIDVGAVRLRVREDSPLVGQPREAFVAADLGDLDVVTVTDARSGEPLRNGPISAGDVLVMKGSADAAAAFASAKRLTPVGDGDGTVADTLFNRNSGLAEVVVPPRSPLIGTAMGPGMVTESGDLVVLAVRRDGEDLGTALHGEVVRPEPVVLRAGDQLLLQGSWKALDARLKTSEVLVVDSPEIVRRQAVPLGIGSQLMLAIVAGMVLLLATGIVPASVGVLLAAMAVIGCRILTVEQAYRAIDWNTIVLVAAMMPLSTAMQQSGTAEGLAELLVRAIGDAGPTMVLVGLFLFTAILGQVISNTATALILIPIAVATAAEFHISALPVLMSLNVGAAAAFLTPVATPPNLIVMAPGGYRFGDYWKLGLALMALYFVIAVFWVPIIWPLSAVVVPQ